jgi:predicted phosphohydrolase
MPDNRSFKFDLVSDLHVDRWPQELDWDALRQNDIVIVAGDVADSIERTHEELERLAKVYKTVLYIDGNHEFCEQLYKGEDDTGDFDDRLRLALSDLPNVHFLKDGVFTCNGLAIIGRNGHWDYKGLDSVTPEEAEEAVAEKLSFPPEAAEVFRQQAKQDAADLRQLVRELNDDPAIHSILVVTHTLPSRKLFPKSVTPVPAHFSNLCNSEMEGVLKEDVNHKVRLWVFGHWHGTREETIEGVRHISHPRGTYRKGKPPYAPLPLEILPPEAAPPAPQITRHPRPPAPPL